EKCVTSHEPQKKVHTCPIEKKLLSRNEPFERPLRVGSVGNDVREMKNALIEKGYLENNAAGGDLFGISTRRAVERIQQDSGLPMTGRVDEETWREIFR
ncbi:MAG: peptidoglycan-binding protein, partial [Clostridia bacterium]|nr:peptidoglycan-binding protein [Clostridia bacterium]